MDDTTFCWFSIRTGLLLARPFFICTGSIAAWICTTTEWFPFPLRMILAGIMALVFINNLQVTLGLAFNTVGSIASWIFVQFLAVVVYYIVGVVLLGLGAAQIDRKASEESQEAAIFLIKGFFIYMNAGLESYTLHKTRIYLVQVRVLSRVRMKDYLPVKLSQVDHCDV